MSWPLSHEFNEAIQSPKATMADPDLRAAEVVVGATGLPLPRSGNFADVYQFRAPDGREWAVKCFTRPVVGLAERYAKLSDALAAAELPFAVGFQFLAEGIRVGGAWRPVLKMEWVEGLLLNQLVRDNTSSQKVLGALGQMWSRLSKRLREVGFAHADVQHGNVLLVPGARPGAYGLKLIDYDGMWVKALANNPSGEVGHPSYQHPDRARTRAYSPDLDRFPHLVVATALRGLSALGPALWDRYDNGDNMLFGEADFRAPAESPLMRELWHAGDAGLSALVGRLAVACGKPIPQTPWLDLIAPEGDPVPLTDAEHRAALEALGLPVPVPVPAPVPVPLPPEPVAPVSPGWVEVPAIAATSDVELVEVEVVPTPPAPRRFEALDEDDTSPARSPRERKKGRASKKKQLASRVPLYAGGALAAVVAVVVAVLLLKGGSKPPEVAEEPKQVPIVAPVDPAPKDPPKKVEPKEGPKVEPKTPNPGTGAGPKQPDRPTRLTVREAWRADIPSTFVLPKLYPTADSKFVLVVSDDGEVVVLDAETGKAVPNNLTKIERTQSVRALRDSLVLVRAAERGYAILDVKTGNSTRLPNVTEFKGPHQFVTPELRLSPNLQYMAVAYAYPWKPSPCSLEFNDRKVIRAFDWVGGPKGHVHFTSDTARVLVADSTGRGQWFKLPGGEPDGEWQLEPKSDPSASGLFAGAADGSVFLHDGPLAGYTGTHHRIDGRTGRVTQSLSGYFPQFGSLSTDGRLAILARRDVAKQLLVAPVVHLATGTEVAQFVPPDNSPYISPTFLPNGRGAVALANPKQYLVLRYQIEDTGVPLEPKQPEVPDSLSDRPLWVKRIDAKSTLPGVAFNEQAGALHVWGNGFGATFDLADGSPRNGFEQLTTGASEVLPLDPKLLQRAPLNPVTIDTIDASSGKIVKNYHVPVLPAPKNDGGSLVRAVLSADARYLAVSRSPTTSEGRPCPVQVYNGDKRLWEGTWTGGTVRFTPDAKRVLLAEVSGRVRWFRLPEMSADGNEWSAERATNFPTRPVVAPDCSTLCVYTTLTHWTLFNAETGKRIVQLRGSLTPAYSADSKRLATIDSPNRVVRVFSTADGRPLAVVPYAGAEVVALSANGSRLAVFDSESARVALFDLSRAPVTPVKPPDPTPVNDGSTPLTGTPVDLVSKWKTELGALKPDRVALVPGAGVLALGSSDGGFSTVDLAKGDVRNTGFIGLRSAPLADLVALDRGQLASLAPKATEFRIWDAKAGSPRALTARFPDLPAGVGEVRAALSPDGKWVAAGRLGGPDAPLRIADGQTPNKPLVSTTWNGGTIHFTDDGTRALVAENGKWRWFQLPSGKDGGEVRGLTETRVAALSADGKRVVLARVETGIPDGRFYVKNGDTGKSVRIMPSAYSARYPVALSPDGTRLAAIRATGPDAPALELIDVDAGTRVAVATLEGKDVSALELAPDAKSLYVVSQKAGTVWAFTVPTAPKP